MSLVNLTSIFIAVVFVITGGDCGGESKISRKVVQEFD